MKKKNIFSVLFTIFLISTLFGQPPNDKKGDEEKSKTIVRAVNEQVQSYLTQGQIKEAERYIRLNRAQCKDLGYKELCNAGLDFTSGYLYQQAAKLDSVNRKSYQNQARRFYQKVMKFFPTNKSALNNWILLNKELGTNNSSITKLQELADKYPKERVDYLVHIGDIYKADENLEMACTNYKEAYKEDPFSAKACSAMVDLYTNDDLSCTMSYDVRHFALDCQEIELPNYSEELLRHETIVEFQANKLSNAMESFILWANVLADNGWIQTRHVDRLYKELFSDSTQNSEQEIKDALDEFIKIISTKEPDNLQTVGFWFESTPVVKVKGDWHSVSPKSVIIRVLRAKGQSSYLKGDLKTAEGYWQIARKQARYYDDAYFTMVASDLAKLYDANPNMDLNDDKLMNLIADLFDMKGASYRDGDLPMIRRYHNTLAVIFYNKKETWSEDGAYTAKFQLERALWEQRFGRIVDPRLRKMLGDVYVDLNRKSEAINSYSRSVQDYLALDQIKEAGKLFSWMNKKFISDKSSKQSAELRELGVIINWRKQFADPSNEIIANGNQIREYLNRSAAAAEKASPILSKDFVKLQFFKGISDLADLLPESREVDKQILYSNALKNLKEVNTLAAPGDYRRIKNIKSTLEESVKERQELDYAQMNKRADLSYGTPNSRSGYRTYSLPTLNKEIIIPEQLFELNTELQSNYSTAIKPTKVVKLKLDNKRNFKTIRNHQ